MNKEVVDKTIAAIMDNSLEAQCEAQRREIESLTERLREADKRNTEENRRFFRKRYDFHLSCGDISSINLSREEALKKAEEDLKPLLEKEKELGV